MPLPLRKVRHLPPPLLLQRNLQRGSTLTLCLAICKRSAMSIKCCKDCVAPKRHIGCHATCAEYLSEKKVELQRYIDAFYRHWLSFIEDNSSKDAESGIEHYKHMACNMAFICELMKEKAND